MATTQAEQRSDDASAVQAVRAAIVSGKMTVERAMAGADAMRVAHAAGQALKGRAGARLLALAKAIEQMVWADFLASYQAPTPSAGRDVSGWNDPELDAEYEAREYGTGPKQGTALFPRR